MQRLNFLTHRFCWKVALALSLVMLGDYLFFQRQLSGGYIGVLALGLAICAIAGRNPIRTNYRAWIALAFAGLFVVALMFDPGLLSWTMFWTAISMATLIISTSQFDDGWLWFQRLSWIVEPHLRAEPLDKVPPLLLGHAVELRSRNGSWRHRLALVNQIGNLYATRFITDHAALDKRGAGEQAGLHDHPFGADHRIDEAILRHLDHRKIEGETRMEVEKLADPLCPLGNAVPHDQQQEAACREIALIYARDLRQMF